MDGCCPSIFDESFSEYGEYALGRGDRRGGRREPGKGGKEDGDDREGREEMVDEMIERVR